MVLAERHGVDVMLGTREFLNSVLFDVVVIGEALNKVSGEVQALAGDVPWRRATDTRNRFIHGYRSMDPSYVVSLIEDDLPAPVDPISRLMAALEREP